MSLDDEREPRRFAGDVASYHVGKVQILAGVGAGPLPLVDVPSRTSDTPIWTAITIQAKPPKARAATDRSIVRAIIEWTVSGGTQRITVDVARQVTVCVPSGRVQAEVRLDAEDGAATPYPPVSWEVTGHYAIVPAPSSGRAFVSTRFALDIAATLDAELASGCTAAEVLAHAPGGVPIGSALARLSARDVDGTTMYSTLLVDGDGRRDLPAAGSIDSWRVTALGNPINGELLQYVGP